MVMLLGKGLHSLLEIVAFGLGDGWLEVKFSKIIMLVKMIAIVILFTVGGRYEKH